MEFVAIRTLGWYGSRASSPVKEMLTWELKQILSWMTGEATSCEIEVAASLVKKGDEVKEIQKGQRVYTASGIKVGFVFDGMDIRLIHANDVGSRLQPDGTLKGKRAPISGNEVMDVYKTGSLMEVFLSKERMLPMKILVGREHLIPTIKEVLVELGIGGTFLESGIEFVEGWE